MKNERENAVKNTTADKLFNFRPVFFTAIFLCLGVVFAYMGIAYDLSKLWLLVWIPLFVAIVFICRKRVGTIKVVLAITLLLVSFFVGFTGFSLKIDAFQTCNRYSTETTVVGKVVEKQEYTYTIKLVLSNVYIGENYENSKLVAYLPASFCENVQLSNEVLLQGFVQTDVSLFDEYGFRAYAIGDDIRLSLTNATACVVTGDTFDLFLDIRNRVEEVVYAGMDETSAAVTMALLAGDDTGIEQGLLENVRHGGIAHIFAVSGLHVGALFAFCLVLLHKTPLQRLKAVFKWLVLAILLFFYAGVCGFSASVLRAAIICLIAYTGRLLLVENDFLQSLGAAATILLIASPTALFEIGFQLSFSACLGLALLSRPITIVCNRFCVFVQKPFERFQPPKFDDDTLPPSILERIRRAVVSFLSVTIAAQIATAPICLQAFGYLSGWSLLLNCVFVPFVSAIFSILLLFVTVACILPTLCAPIVLYLPSIVWSAALLVFETVDFSTFAITGVYLSGGASICYYGGFLFLTDKWNISHDYKHLLSMLCFIAFAATVVALNV